LTNEQKNNQGTTLWCSYFFNPNEVNQLDQFKKKLKKTVKQYQAELVSVEEITSFVVFSIELPKEFTQDKNKTKRARNGAPNVILEIKKSLETIYSNSISSLYDNLTKEKQNNKELKETADILAKKLDLSPEDKENFNKKLESSIENWLQNITQVIRGASLYLWFDFRSHRSIILFNEQSLDLEGDKNTLQLLDELVLNHFSKQYLINTKNLLEGFSNNLFRINDGVREIKQKNSNLVDLLDLLKGKSFEVADNIHDIRRQLARQKLVKEQLRTELKHLADDNVMNLTIYDKELSVKEITDITDKALKALDDWFEIIRNIESYDLTTKEKVLSEKIIQQFINLFVKMELMRLWSEFFYDISYFTFKKGRVFDSPKKSIKETIDTDAVLVVEDIYKTYRLPKSQVYALRGVSFEIKRGEFISIMGPSGAGKTTLVNIITGLDSPDKGAVYLNGKNIALMGDRELTEFRRDEVGLIFQFYQLFGELTAIENVSMPLEMAHIPVKQAREKALEILKIVDLEKFANQYPDKLSGGQQQRVAIARALINNPSILVADQLTGDLDSITGMQIIDYLEKINKEEGATILLALIATVLL
jgi:putative ABC transport system ATP-binding protein